MNCFNAKAQINHVEFGARSKGLGNSNSTLTDEWSIFNNPGGISGVKSGVVFFGYDRVQSIEGFDKVAAGVIQPFKFGNVGLGFFKFGDELYSEQSVSLDYGNKVGFVSLGFRANYYQMHIDQYGTAGTLSFDIGGIVELIPKVNFGAYISNFTLAKLSNPEHSELPVVMKLGFVYMPVNELKLYMDIYKDIAYKPIVRVALEYVIVEKFYLRTGINTDPFASHFGGGILLNRFKIDYAFSNNDFLGLTHQATVSFIFHKIDED